MADYDLGRALVRIEIDRSGLRSGLAAAHAETAAEVAAMQRDINAGTRAMSRSFSQFATDVRNAMSRTTADVNAASAASVRKLDEISRAAGRTVGSLDALATAADNAAGRLSRDWEKAAVAADHSADSQVDAIHRIERALAELKAEQAMVGGDRRIFTGGPAGVPSATQFVGTGGTNTVRLDAAQYAGLLSAILSRGGGGGGGTTIVPSAGGGGDGGGGGSGLLSALLFGRQGAGIHRIGGRLGFPIFGAGLGSIGSFAGLGAEHVLMTGLGLAGSAVGGAIGGGLLAGGALAKTVVGGGADIAAMRTAQSNIKNTTSAIDAYNTAVATYGKNSTEAQRAQQQMNFAIKDMPKQLQAQNLAIAKANLALSNYWKQSSIGAVHQAYTLIQAGQQIVHEYIPLVGQAAAQNLAIINTGLKPLFSWIKGPDGLAIFNDLETQFQQQLPTAVHTFSQATEFLLRLLDQASHHTGGLMQWLDKLFTRLNNLSNPQIDYGVMKFIRMFREWKDLIKALGTDIILLFRNEAGTASSILQTLTHMLNKVGDWERTISARQQMHTIFQVHKEQILAILHMLGLLLPTFTKVYLTLGPPFTRLFTTLVGGINALLRGLEKIPGGTWVVGLTLLSAKLFGISKTFGLIRSGLHAVLSLLAKSAEGGGAAKMLGGLATLTTPGAIWGTKSAEKAVTSEGAAVAEQAGASAGGASSVGLIPRLLARFGGTATEALVAATRAIPVVAAVSLAVLGLDKLLNAIAPGFSGQPGVIPSRAMPAGPTGLSRILQNRGVAGLDQLRTTQIYPGRGGGQGTRTQTPIDDIAKTKAAQEALKNWLHTAENSQKVAGANAQQLAKWHREGDALAKLFPGMRDEINKDNKAIEHQRAAVHNVQNLMSMHWTDAGIKSVKDLKDAFVTNMTLIAKTINLHSATGRRLMLRNVDEMISHTLEGMKKGKIGVQQGMAAIEHSIDVGMKNGALTATQATSRMVNTLESLYKKGRIHATDFGKELVSTFQTYSRKGANIWDQGTTDILRSISNLRAKGKITSQQMMDDVSGIWKSGIANLNRQTSNWYNTQLALYQKLRKNGTLTQKEYNADIAGLEQQRNSRSKGNIEAWAQNILNGMVQSGKISLGGAQSIAKQLNELLVGLHASKIPVPTSVAVSAYTAQHGLASAPGHRGQSGAIWQVGRQGERGGDSVPMMIGDEPYRVAPGEQVVVLTQHHQRELNSLFAPIGGLPGYFSRRRRPHSMATGGYVFPIASGVTIGRTDMGVDPLAPAGKPFGPIGNAQIVETGGGGWPGGPYMSWQLTSGPLAGRFVYLAEMIRPTVRAGQHVTANQAIAVSTGPSQEMGWAAPGGATTLSVAHHTENLHPNHSDTPEGLAFRAFLLGLAHGNIVGGAGMATINTPQAKGPDGPYKTAVQRSFDKGTEVANAYYQKKLAASGILGGSFSGISFSSQGPVEARIAADAKRVGVNKIGIAGIIGNAYAESTIDPASIGSGGGGLFGFTPLGPEQAYARSQGKPWTDVDTQMAYMFHQWFQQDPGAISAINAQQTPSSAADYFMNTYEHPGVKRASVRESAAQSAYAQGYQRGGILDMMRRRQASRSAFASGAAHHHGGAHHRSAAELRRKYPHAWAFIRHLSPGFPPQELSEQWLHMLEHQSAWTTVKQGSLSKSYLDFFFKWLNHVSAHEIPLLQEKASSISDLSGAGGHTPHAIRQIRGLDRHAAALAIQGAHAIMRLQDAVEIANKRNRKKPPFTAQAKQLHTLANTFMGISGRGGLVHDTELALMQEAQGGTPSGPHSQHMLQLLRQQNAFLREQLAVERAQYRALTDRGAPPGVGMLHGGMLAFGGMMHNGGVIPGPPGMPVNVFAQAGERIVERGGDPGPIKVVIEKRGGTDQLIDARVERYGRRVSGRVGYGLPSRGGF